MISSPSFVDGVAYLAIAGAIAAVNVTTAMQIWTYQDPAGDPIASSPALTGNTLIVGTAAGDLMALNATTGALVWTDNLNAGAVDSSPAIVGGTAYVGATDGYVDAVNITTGAMLWATRLPGAISGSPAVDPKQSLLVVGDQTGVVSALATANGA